MMKIFTLFIFALTTLVSCKKSEIDVRLFKNRKSAAAFSITNVRVVNHQVVIEGSGFNNLESLKIKDGPTETILNIESSTDSTIVANGQSNLTLVAGKILNLILSDAKAASSFTINFSLCDSLLGGKVIDCNLAPNDKEVLSYDAVSQKWKPRAINGLSYLGAWDASGGLAPTLQPSGTYYVISVAGTIGGVIFDVGDWIVSNGTIYQKIDNSQAIISVFGRTGNVTADLNDLSDVVIAAPTNGQVLRFNGTNWVAANVTYTETDPTVQAYAKSALPTCGAGQVLKSDGSTFSCVTDSTGAGAFTGTADRVVVTNGSGALATSGVSNTILNYLTNVTSDVQTQINGKLNSGTFVDWSTSGAQTLDPTRLNLISANRVVITNGTSTPIASTVTATELGYLSGVTSNIQTQLNTKISSETDPNVSAFAKSTLPTCNAGEVLKADGTTLTCVTDNSGAGAYTGAINQVVVTNGTTGALSNSSISTTELGYLSGASSNIQTQLNAKQGTLDKSSVQDLSKLRIYGANTTNYVELSASTLTANRILNFPDSNGSNGYVLSTNGAGNLSWIAIPSAPVTSVFGRTGVVVATTGDYSAAQITNTAAGNIVATDVQAAINELDTEKQSISTLATDIMNTVLSTFTLNGGSKPDVANTDTIVQAFGKVQKSIDDIDGDYVSKSSNNNVTGSFNLTGIASFLQIPTPSGAIVNEAANVQYVQNYVLANGQWAKGSGGNANDIYYNTGKVSIGSSTPLVAFQVTGANFSTDFPVNSFLIDNAAQNANVGGGVAFGGYAVNASTSPIAFGAIRAAKENSTSGDNLGYLSLMYRTQVKLEEGLRINSSGNVGIGTTSPTDKLSVQSPSSTLASFYNTTAGGSTTLSLLGLNGAGDTNTQAVLSLGNETAANASSFLALSTRAAAGSVNEVMRLTSTGNVGIGVTIPLAKMDVNGTTRTLASVEGAEPDVNSGATITIPNLSKNVRRITLTANTTITLPDIVADTNLPTDAAYSLTIKIKQDATGSRTLAWAANTGEAIKWDMGSAPAPSSAANSETIYQFFIIGGEANWYGSMVWLEQ